MSTIIDWNGREVPEEMRSLPAGRYVVESVDAVPQLTEAEQAGLEAAIGSLRRGEGVERDEVRHRLDAAMKR